jgi:hypothetical protein
MISRCEEIQSVSLIARINLSGVRGGLTRSQKRRVQRLHQLEIIEEEKEQTSRKKGVQSQVWRVKTKADDESASNSSTPIQVVGSSESSKWMSS